ncbi:hypothetical protein PYW07_001630 [Mythimna separata]|uniref:SCP domain-containing protein n=1 Tax=Mythimna separata TaxID=271217 RepID=A0AAD7YST3_MYTSE|nr:hypothetical protein PYW07_001630 [Mythimna separata]
MNIILFSTISILFIPKCLTKDYCSPDYCNNSKQHTLCKYRSPEPASHCVAYEKTILSENDRRLILDKINSRRNKVAAGEIRSLPAAGSMLKLKWNKELEISAQRWADQCVRHRVPDMQDTCRDLGKMSVGQNIATIHGDAPGLTPLALVDVWYMELLNINYTTISRYVPSSEIRNLHYDYFTQLMWEETNQVGCGGVKFKESLEDVNVKYRTIYRLVCNFAPAGNVRNKSVYSSGMPCSRCPSDTSCDSVHKALCCTKKTTPNDVDIGKEKHVTPFRADDKVIDHTTHYILRGVVEAVTEESTYVTEVINKTTSDITLENDTLTQFDFFSHLYEFTKQMITPPTTPHSCKDIMAVEDFVELLKKKLSNDPMIKDLLSSSNKPINSNSESSFHDVGVAAFVDRLYSKKIPTTIKNPVSSDYVNSTFLVDLIEAVIFRNGDKMPVSEGNSANTLPLTSVKHIRVQAELPEVRQNYDFSSGHYFFPEENEEIYTESTESYYDDINLPTSDLEHLKMSTVTKDFLYDIIESDTASESTTTLVMLSPDNINLYKSGQGVMKKFLQNIAEKPQSNE